MFNLFSNRYKYRIILVLLSVVLSGCATTSPTSSTTPRSHDMGDSRDPLESINRPFWTFTWDYADKYVMKPVANFYSEYMPTFVRDGIYNMALNLNEPASVVNNLLQLKFSDAGKGTKRFVLNSTIGLFGFFDPASDFGWQSKEEEFGEVLGSYGVGDGPFLVVPVLGPSSVREEVGDYIDKLYWPMAVIDFWPNILRVTVLGLEKRISIKDQEQLVNESVDSYEFIKNAYFQNMNYKLYDGNPPIVVDEAAEAEIEALLGEIDE